MSSLFQFTLLGLGAGAMYALLGQGLVAIYRGSGVLNFAHGVMAMVGGFLYYELRNARGWSFVPAFVAAVAIVALIAVATHLVIMWRLRDAPPLVKVIITLGVFTALQGLGTIIWGNDPAFVTESLPSSAIRVFGVTIGEDRFYLLGIAVALTVGLWLAYRYTTIGMATRATAENPVGVAALGWSPGVIGGLNWALGGALAAAAGILIVPLSGLQVSQTSLLVIPALAAALIGGFTSFPLTLVGGLIIGIAESLSSRYITVTGFAETFPLIVILAVLLIRGNALPLRSEANDLLPRAGRGGVRPIIAVVGIAACAGVVAISSVGLSMAIGNTLVIALFLLSLVVVIGNAGQLSLAQVSLGGVGAFTAAKLISQSGLPFEVALLAGLATSLLVGVLFGLPAVRARGVQLAVVTMSLGFGLQQMVFNNSSLGGTSTSGVVVGSQKLFGLNISQQSHPDRFADVALVAFALCAAAVATMRSGRVGRRLLAVRANERAAAGVGISVAGAKLYAFGLASMIAGLGGILLAFENPTIYFTTLFDPFLSILIVSFLVLGGIGYISGAIIGATLGAGALFAYIGTLVFGNGFAVYLAPIGGFGLIFAIAFYPNGSAALISDRIGALLPARTRKEDQLPEAEETRRVRSAKLEIRDLTVRFGGTVAVDHVSFDVSGGEVVGIIGPNGAGKTTIIDAITGYVRPREGDIVLDGTVINGWAPHRRVRAGVSRSFQSLELFEDLTIRDNVRAASDRRDFWAYVTNLFHSGNVALPPVVAAAVREFGLEPDLDQFPTELPYGRRRLAAVARALATGSSMLLLDEPAAGLGDDERAELRAVVRRLADTWGLGIILIEHDVEFVMNVCDRIIALDFGCEIASGSPSEVRANPAVIRSYLGEPSTEPQNVGVGHDASGTSS